MTHLFFRSSMHAYPGGESRIKPDPDADTTDIEEGEERRSGSFMEISAGPW